MSRQEAAASYVDLGDKFARAEDFDRAIRAYTIAIEFAPEFAPA